MPTPSVGIVNGKNLCPVQSKFQLRLAILCRDDVFPRKISWQAGKWPTKRVVLGQVTIGNEMCCCDGIIQGQTSVHRDLPDTKIVGAGLFQSIPSLLLCALSPSVHQSVLSTTSSSWVWFVNIFPPGMVFIVQYTKHMSITVRLLCMWQNRSLTSWYLTCCTSGTVMPLHSQQYLACHVWHMRIHLHPYTASIFIYLDSVCYISLLIIHSRYTRWCTSVKEILIPQSSVMILCVQCPWRFLLYAFWLPVAQSYRSHPASLSPWSTNWHLVWVAWIRIQNSSRWKNSWQSFSFGTKLVSL